MANINEILQRAASLRDETALNSISPERAGGIMYDTLIALNELWLQQGSALVISKIYASVSAMEADTAPVSDLTGQPLRPGQIVVIASSDSDNGSVYRYNGTTSPSWTSVGKIGNLEPVDSLDSDSTSLPLAAHQGKVLDGKISQLGQDIDKLVQNIQLSFTDGGFYLRTFEIYPFSGCSYVKFNNTHIGEKYVLFKPASDIYSSPFSGFLGSDDSIIKSWAGNVEASYELIEITEDGQSICISVGTDLVPQVYLCKLMYIQPEIRLNTLERYNPKFWENIPIEWIEGGFVTTLLTVYTPFEDGKYFEFSDTHAGEKYIIYSDGTLGDFTQGLRGTGGQVIKKWTGGLVNWELLEITEDGQTICMCCPKDSNPNPWKSRIVKIYYYKNEIDILDLKSRINDLTAQAVRPATSAVSGLGVLDIAYPNFDYNHIITYGQSFSEGGGGVGKYDIIQGNYMIGNSVQISGKSNRSQLNGLTSNSNGAIATQCTNAFSLMWRKYRNPSANFVASAGGHGGSTLAEISKGTTYYTDFLAEIQALKDIATAENKTAGCIAILFIQGESGGGTGYSTKDSYKYLMDKLKNDMQDDIMTIYGQDSKPIFITYQTGLSEWLGSNGGKIYPQAQLEYAMDNEDVILGCPSYFAAFTTTNHPSGNGYSMIGELMGKYLFSAMNAGNRMQSIHPYSFEIKNNSIFISLDVPVPPLVLDTHTVAHVTDYGFKVFVNNTDTQISSINVFGNQIVISMPQDLTGKMVEIYYATKAATSGGGRGNVCDSDKKYMSYQTYGQELESETMKYYPVDENGRTLYGRRLPLQNWLCNFYKNIRLCFDIHMLKVKVSDTGFANRLNNELGLEVNYSSSNTEVATIATDGTLTFLETGWCVITASVTLNGVTYSDTYLLIVES